MVVFQQPARVFSEPLPRPVADFGGFWRVLENSQILPPVADFGGFWRVLENSRASFQPELHDRFAFLAPILESAPTDLRSTSNLKTQSAGQSPDPNRIAYVRTDFKSSTRSLPPTTIAAYPIRRASDVPLSFYQPSHPTYYCSAAAAPLEWTKKPKASLASNSPKSSVEDSRKP
jgi:hypothetical protein